MTTLPGVPPSLKFNLSALIIRTLSPFTIPQAQGYGVVIALIVLTT